MLDKYVCLEDAIGQAVGDHVITPLPDEQPQSEHAYSQSRLNTIRDRLTLLGYQVSNTDGGEQWQALEPVVEKFQQAASGEMRLRRDGWVGEHTWLALQELISFEAPSHLEKWMKNGKPCPALKRALHLRLFALGLIEIPPGRNIKPSIINAGLRHLAEVAKVLRWDELRLQTSLRDIDLATLELIFNQDGFVERLAGGGSVKGLENLRCIRPFVIAMAKIELWLAGYEIKPDGYGEGDRTFEQSRGLDLHDNHPLYPLLVQYWEGLGKDKRSTPEMKATCFVKWSFPDFFKGIHALLAESEEEAPDSEDVFEQLNIAMDENKNDTLLQQIWDHISGIGARVWDGIKRAWRWLSAMVKKGLGKMVGFVKNLSRIAYQYILKAYEGVRAVIKGVAGSIAFFSKRVLELPMESLGVSVDSLVLFSRDFDSDYRVLVRAESNPDDLCRIADYVSARAGLFSVSCDFLASFLDILLGLLKKVWLVSWAGLLMALLKLYKSISHWAPIFIEAQRHEEALGLA
ncbi:peptidoglycan-binding protein [Mariprofundus sp. EBB-1]|nr:peptidoglycan-binding protein [Mariprofundus sp. EBB-1]